MVMLVSALPKRPGFKRAKRFAQALAAYEQSYKVSGGHSG